MKRAFAILAGVLVLAVALMALFRLEPVALVYTVWNAVPGTVVDEDGRVGRLYSNGSSVVHAVVFEWNYQPRQAGFFDRLVVPPPSDRGIHSQITFDVKTLRCGTGNSDEIFNDFLLSRNPGVGWNGDGVVEMKLVGKGRDQQYVAALNGGGVIRVRLSSFSMRQRR